MYAAQSVHERMILYDKVINELEEPCCEMDVKDYHCHSSLRADSS